MLKDTAITGLTARAYTVPTDQPEADGTLSWNSTTMIVVELSAGGQSGIGYTYADPAAATLINGKLGPLVTGGDAMDIRGHWMRLRGAVRNLGRSGLASSAIAAIDTALWDLKARLLDLPLASLLGQARSQVEIYGSGGFTSYDNRTLAAQLAGWVERDGCRAVKMKIGSEPERDPARVAAARHAIGDAAQLFVDANGAFSPRTALHYTHLFADMADIRWMEEPVSSDDLAGLVAVRGAAPSRVDIAAGEYVYTEDDARHMLAAEAVDVQQADITRCGGLTGFLDIAALTAAHHRDLSAHCAPALHLHAACAVERLRHLEWFHDHVRIEHMFFDGAPVPHQGAIAPDMSRPGHGLSFKRSVAERYAA
jgi:L-alanine-DL-glutamate epimerase-like enolase superfamily enzyme